MNAYQRLCLNESSNGLSIVFDMFPLTDNQDINSIIVPKISISIADVVVLSCACDKQDAAIIIQRIDSDLLESEQLSYIIRRVQSICKHVKKQFCVPVNEMNPTSIKLV